eukprot:scaffold34609_cov146-Amphora_coffeaeformis.AAC.6
MPTTHPPPPPTGRTVFVTVGTTLFESLIQVMTNERVLEKLVQMGFSKLILQYGKGSVPTIPSSILPLEVEMYDFKDTLSADIQRADLIIGHAGAGTVSEVLRYRPPKKLVVVINTALMHNHQTELAHAMRDRHHLLVVEEPTMLLLSLSSSSSLPTAVWDEITKFVPVPLEPGDPHDFPRLLNSFLTEDS